MSKYLCNFKIKFLSGLQYRAAAISGAVTQIAWGIMLILMYQAFYRTAPEAFPMSFSSMSSYIWLQQAGFAMFAIWFYDEEIFESISSGNVCYDLTRPCDLYTMWFTKNMAIRVSRALMRAVPMLILAICLPSPFGLSLPKSPLYALLFILSFVMGFLLVVAFVMLIYISAFYTINPTGTKIIASTLGDFLAGSIIPIPFLPTVFQNVLYCLPFAYMQNTPFLIYTGEVAIFESLKLMCGQMFWIFTLVLIGKLLTDRAMKRISIQGG